MGQLALLIISAVIALACAFEPAFGQAGPDKITVGTITLSLNNCPSMLPRIKAFSQKKTSLSKRLF